MRRWWLGAAVLLVAVATHAVVGVWTLLETCRVSDTATEVPAPASPQGRVCDAQDHWLNLAPWVLLVLGVVVSVALAVRLVGSRWRWVGITACLWVPLVVAGTLAVPPDACSPEQYADAPAYACSRTGNG